MKKRTVFYISDRTGITAEVLGHALISQFDNVLFKEVTIPFIDNEVKLNNVIDKVNAAAEADGARAILFDTIVNPEHRKKLHEANAMVMDFFHTFVGPLEEELETQSSFRIGVAHGMADIKAYDHRIEAVNFSLNNDDGQTTRYYGDADLILLGVSRCGKTPTSLYIAMQYGLKVANYPFIAEDMSNLKLPRALKLHKEKLFGLTILPDRLHDIRTERRANSNYASLQQCQLEVRTVEQLFRRERIPFLNTTTRSIEEIASRILVKCNLRRKSQPA
jgi:regulator of PEP synthase PpsR (kinase-PPPase family)